MGLDVLAIASAVISGLLVLVAFLARRQIDRVEQDVKDNKAAADRQMSLVTADLRLLERQVDRECINKERLDESLAPLVQSLERVGTNVDELFRRLDNKQDKRGGD